MKRLLSIGIALLLTVTVSLAQSTSGSGVLKSSPTHVPTDTVVNTGAKSQSLAISVANSMVSIQTDLTTITGTPAGVVRLYGSLNGTKYVRILPTDSLVVNANALSKVFIVSEPAYSFYRVTYTGSGTMSVKMNSQAAWRKE